MEEVQARLYELNCANAAWHESAIGQSRADRQLFSEGYKQFSKALQWFKDKGIKVETRDDPTHRGIYVLSE